MRLKEQGHQDQLNDCVQWEQTVFQLALDEDWDRHEQFKRLIELENLSLEQEIKEVLLELENIKRERAEQAQRYNVEIAQKAEVNRCKHPVSLT